MKVRTGARTFVPALLGTLALLAALVPMQATQARSSQASSHPCVVGTGAGDTTFVRNFNPFGAAMDFTIGGIYEPLYVIVTAGGGHEYPWLATAYKWTDSNHTLLLTIRDGVKWSDGQPFTAKDVLFTLTAGTINAALDQGVGYAPRATSNIASINIVGSNQVALHFKKVDTTVLSNIVSGIKVIPQHIWASIKNPTTFTNPNPVGTGPYTEVQKFSGQDYILGKNPHYWQPGKPVVSCLERSFASGNDAAMISMVHGDVDWTGNFVPNVQKVYVARDPQHFHYFYATPNTPAGLFFNDLKYPYTLVDFRKALSMAINRQQVSTIGEYGYAPPADATGLAFQFPGWVNHALDSQSKMLTTYNKDAAKALLTKIGFTNKGGQLYDPKGNKVSIVLNVINGWTDWVLSMQIIEKNLKDIGIDASVKLSPDYNSWSAQADKGLVPHLHWTYSGSTPYTYFNSTLGPSSFVPTGTPAGSTGNWARFVDPAAAPLLARFKSTADTATQRQLANKLQVLEIKDFPYIPLFIGPSWYTYSTKYFTGWPTQQDPYVNGQMGAYPDRVVVLTRLVPAK